MVFVVVALVALLAVQHYLAGRERARLIDALMARNAGEYALIKKAQAPKGKGAKQSEPEPATGWMIGA